MNRLQTLVQSSLSVSRTRLRSTKRIQDEGQLSIDFPHQLFTPVHYESNYDYPLVIWLHSPHSSEYELGGLMPHLSLRNYVAASIRGTAVSPHGERLFTWSNTASAYAVAEEMVYETISAIQARLSIHRERIFMAGYGLGGSLAQWIGLRNPDRFAGVISVNASFPNRARTLARWKEARHLPVLSMHGTCSTACDEHEFAKTLETTYRCGLQYHFHQFDCGDELESAMCSTADRFMMHIVTGQPLLDFVRASDDFQSSEMYRKDAD